MMKEKTMGVRYFLLQEEVQRENQVQETYGIAMIEEEKVLDQVSDVCDNKEKAQELVNILNSQNVSSVHFRDVLYDWVAGT